MKMFLAAAILLFGLAAAAHAQDAELVERRAVIDKASAAFIEGNFHELERQVQSYMTVDRRTSSGAFKIEQFDDGITEAMDFQGPGSEAKYQDLIFKTEAWAAKFPDAPLAHVLRARALLSYAYYFRGNKYADKVPPEAWAPFEKYSQQAARVLLESQAVASAYTGWHATVINTARSLGWPRELVLKVVSDGIRRNPDDFRLYHHTLVYFLPRWHGSDQELAEFVEQAERATFDRHGLEIYARLYSAAEQYQYKRRLYADSGVSWTKMKQGLEDWNARFPTPWNLNIYAYHACIANDKATTKKLLEKIGPSPLPGIWKHNAQIEFSTCQQFANEP